MRVLSPKNSPIYGMPILDVQSAREVYVIKRGKEIGRAHV